MRDKNKKTFWVATVATGLDSRALTCVFGSENTSPYPVRATGSGY